ncbi:MAG: hypothetical protein ACI85I_002652 [Arenicella sp.]
MLFYAYQQNSNIVRASARTLLIVPLCCANEKVIVNPCFLVTKSKRAATMTTKGNKNRTIVLPITSDIYGRFMFDNKFAHETIKDLYEGHMDLFPAQMLSGYKLNGRTRLSKNAAGFQMRKIKVTGTNYQIRPSYMFPYCKEQLDFVSKGLFLLKFGVPFWALAFVFGYNGRDKLLFGNFSMRQCKRTEPETWLRYV